MSKPSKFPLYAKMLKRGQVYIIAAIIISALIMGLGVVYNIARATEQDTKIYDLSREIDFETTKIVDWGELNDNDPKTKISSLLDYYAKSNPDAELAAALIKEKDDGSLDTLITKYYKIKTSGSAVVQGSGAGSALGFFTQDSNGEIIIDWNQPTKTLKISLSREFEGAEEHTFKLKKGKNLYIILIRDKQTERLVSAPERA